MRILRYSLLRLLILALVAGLLYLFGMRSWLLALASIVIAGLIAYLVLPSARLGAAREVQERATKRQETQQRDGERASRSRGRQDAEDEDAEIDQLDEGEQNEPNDPHRAGEAPR